MFGAVEIRYVKGPVLLDRSYVVTGVVVAHDAGGEVVATCCMMTRFVKASSPLYAP